MKLYKFNIEDRMNDMHMWIIAKDKYQALRHLQLAGLDLQDIKERQIKVVRGHEDVAHVRTISSI